MNTSGLKLGRGKGEIMVDNTPAKIKAIEEGKRKRLVIRITKVTTIRML
jgi:hypothetical protein